MSSIIETMIEEVGGGTLSKVAGSLGVSGEQMQGVLASALPAFVQHLASNAQTPEGASALAAALDKNHGPNLIDQLAPLAGQLLGTSGGGLDLGALLGAASGLLGGGDAASPSVQALGALPALDGAGILKHVFGGKLDGVIDQISKVVKLDPGKILKILTTLGPIVMSALGTLKSKFGLDPKGLASLLSNDADKLGASDGSSGGGLDLGAVGSMLSNSGLLAGLFG
ncbi:MAG: DUF937 domain-containing protein [Kofleriaceae bacterium]